MIKLGGRSLPKIARALTQPRHYRAALNMMNVCHRPGEVLYRYLTGRGAYPWDVPVKTPLGTIIPRVYSHAALLTLNEIFCRLDYWVNQEPKVVVDIGSNVGLSALYFLTRNRETRCYLFEPVPDNVVRLQHNLLAYGDRYVLDTNAVADVEGTVEFGIEPTGRYGGIGVRTGRSIHVRCRSINSILEEVLSREKYIDLLKIDTEGAEESTIRAISPTYLDRIGTIYAEARPTQPLLRDWFRQAQDGEVVRMFNRRW